MLNFVFHSENCIQCHACEAACKSWRQLERGVTWRRVCAVWHGKYPNTSLTSFTVSCMHCLIPACAEVCPTGAISKRAEDGIVLVNRELCTGCRICFDACPVGAPQFGADSIMQKCDFCSSGPQAQGGVPACILACPTQALESVSVNAEKKAAIEKNDVEQYNAACLCVGSDSEKNKRQ